MSRRPRMSMAEGGEQKEQEDETVPHENPQPM
jgi:hypothetical protein